ncbi:MAG: nitroreductase family protein [Gammaproteobacteria bacterium]|nr:nitroreductase family protein [Gammaproteobacteria bacterium]
MDFDEVVRTTFAARAFTDDPVDDATVEHLLETARFAPSGGNRQGWRVIVVRDAGTRSGMKTLMEPVARRYMAQRMAGENPFSTITPTQVTAEQEDAVELPPGLLDWVDSAPVILVVCVDLDVVASFDVDLDRVGVISGASIYPFAWNILLTARSLGLGGTLTTFLAGSEPAACELLGIPAGHAIAAVLPIGRPPKQLTRLTRRPVREFATRERFDGASFG